MFDWVLNTPLVFVTPHLTVAKLLTNVAGLSIVDVCGGLSMCLLAEFLATPLEVNPLMLGVH